MFDGPGDYQLPRFLIIKVGIKPLNSSTISEKSDPAQALPLTP